MALRSFREGDTVKAIVRSIDSEKKRISLGLKPSYFSEEDFEDKEDNEEDAPEAFGVIDEDAEMSDAEGDEEGDADVPSEGDEPSDDEEAMAVDIDLNSVALDKPPTSSTPSVPAPSLQLQGGFQWSGGDIQDDDESASSEESEDEDQSGKKKKKKRKEIELDLTADMDTKTPESNADFERLLLGSPNSSYLWIQYMSFQLQLSEIDKAREVAKRALQTISFREEKEKLNVWMALLNLENVYGTDESLETAFKDAARHNDSKTVHLRFASILEQSEKFEVRPFPPA